jgi:hypothetical protein
MNKESGDFIKNNINLIGRNKIDKTIDSLHKWNQLIMKLNPSVIYRIEDEEEKLFNYLKDNNIPVEWYKKDPQKNKTETDHPSWDKMIEEFGPISKKAKRKLNVYCNKFGYPKI